MIHLNNQIKKTEFIGFIFVCVLGTILHFVYDLTGENYIIGLFVPVNESVWEHLKLIFYPALIFSFVEYYFLRQETNGFFTAKSLSLILAMSITVCAFYGYTAITEKNYLWADITIFSLSVIISYIISCLYSRNKFSGNLVGTNLMLIFIGLFTVFSFFQPDIFIFREP